MLKKNLRVAHLGAIREFNMDCSEYMCFWGEKDGKTIINVPIASTRRKGLICAPKDLAGIRLRHMA
jgi:hypothetical protein